MSFKIHELLNEMNCLDRKKGMCFNWTKVWKRIQEVDRQNLPGDQPDSLGPTHEK